MATNAAVIIDKTTLTPIMIVVPDFDSQLSDPSFNPPNSMQVLIPIATYQINTLQQISDIVSQAIAQLNTVSL